jgi:predicted nucleic acid-binding protein
MGRTPVALTTDFILDEAVTILGKRKGFGALSAVKVAESILSSPRVFTVYIDEALLKEALKLYPTYEGRLSLTDVATVAVMGRYGVRNIFSHDRDFEDVEGIKRVESTNRP